MIEKDYPKFPCVWLDLPNWNLEWLSDLFRHNDLAYSGSEILLDTQWLDSDGKLYKVSGIEPFAKWRRFVPLIPKGKLMFTYQNKILTLQEVKDYLLSNILILKKEFISEEGRKDVEEWKARINSAENFKELYKW